MIPRKQCNHAGCSVLVPYNVAYCDAHQPVQESVPYWQRPENDTRYLRFYKSKAWKRLSYQYRLSHPCCEWCMKNDIIRKADVVDHIIEIKDDYSRRLDPSNLQSLCHSCHNKKTATARLERATPRKDRGL